MKTRFWKPAIAGLAIAWLGAAAAQGANNNWDGSIQRVPSAEYSVVRGTAFATDAEPPSGLALADDPSWIVRQQGTMPQYNPQAGRAPAQSAASKANDEGRYTTASNSVDKNSDQKESGTCDSCGDKSCGNCCNDCCHERHCHGLINIPDCCPLYCCDEEPERMFDCCWMKENDIALYGWVEGGIMGNGQSPDSHFNGPVTFPDRDDGQFNQFYGVLERTAGCNNCGWFFGGRADLYWGSDFAFTTAAGLDGQPNGNRPRWNTSNSFLYGWSMPQLYAEVDYQDLRVRLGHFYTILGYEMAPAIGNFFYTHSYTRQYGEPFTSTGVLFSQPLDCHWTWHAGIDNGWNTFDCDSRANFIGAVTYTDDCWGSLTFAIQSGDDSIVNQPGIAPVANRTTYSVVWQRNFTSRLTYVLEQNLGVQQDGTQQGTAPAEWYGLTQYCFYRIDCCWAFGVRFECFRDDDGFAVSGLRPGNPMGGSFVGNFYETSLGLNYKPSPDVVIRPEVRWDWFNPDHSSVGNQNPFDDNNSKNQFLFGVDAIVQF